MSYKGECQGLQPSWFNVEVRKQTQLLALLWKDLEAAEVQMQQDRETPTSTLKVFCDLLGHRKEEFVNDV